ncbi:hypothetical protein HERIO_264 [Hepatospora eriocheir]|uniref:Uncharacterized protein n=1 Tax=Hepatospora eriocheir TaxID=1081669 RepID=A0A1X0QDM3_9MICR|nr:hypothetical protein HERIO_264 [Hepatospora eriocheir]
MNDEIHKKIFFSDKVEINLFISDGARYVRYYPGEIHNSKNTVPTVKHGRGCVMVFWCILYQGVVELIFIENTMKGCL